MINDIFRKLDPQVFGGTMARSAIITSLALSLAALSGCAADSGGPSSEAADSSAQQAVQSVPAEDASKGLGIDHYEISQDAASNNVRLIDGKGAHIADIGSFLAGSERRQYYSNGRIRVELSRSKEHMDAWVDGRRLGSFSLQDANVLSDVDPGESNSAELTTAFERIRAVGQDEGLKSAVEHMREGTPYMFGWPDCPWWVTLGGCGGAFTFAGALVCGGCIIAWL